MMFMDGNTNQVLAWHPTINKAIACAPRNITPFNSQCICPLKINSIDCALDCVLNNSLLFMLE